MAAPAEPAPPARTTWVGWQVALVSACALLVGAALGVLLFELTDDDAPDDTQRSALVAPGPSSTAPTVANPPSTRALPATGSVDAPAPLGSSARLGDWIVAGWRVAPDGDAAMAAFDPANPPARPGSRFVVAETELVYAGSATGDPSTIKLYATDSTGQAWLEGCGRVPAPLRRPATLRSGEAVSGQVCFEVPTDRVEGLQVVLEVALGQPVHFALD